MFHLCEQSWNFACARTLCGFSCVMKSETTMCIATDILLDATCCHFTKTYFVQYLLNNQTTSAHTRNCTWVLFLRWFRSCVAQLLVAMTRTSPAKSLGRSCVYPSCLNCCEPMTATKTNCFILFQSLLLCWCDADLKGTEIVKDFRNQELL